MKTCTKCKSSRPLEDFNNNRARPDGKATMCRECWKSYYKDYYYNQPNERQRLKKKNNTARDKVLAYVKSLKEDMPCTDCGVKYPYYVMDFDHLQDKSFSIAKKVRTLSMKRIIEEIAKCELVCSNCHRARTWQRLQVDNTETTVLGL